MDKINMFWIPAFAGMTFSRITLVLVFTLAFALSTHAQDMDAFLKSFSEKRAGINSLKASFTQNTVLPDETLESPGTLVFAKPRRIVMRTTEPPLTTLIDDRRAYEYDPKIKQVSIYDLDKTPQAEIFFLGFDSDLKSMNEAYTLGFFEPGNQKVPTTGLSITPKESEHAENYFKEVRLYLENDNLLPYKIHIINEDSEIITLIEKYTINPAVEKSDTQIDLPTGTYIIENDQMKEAVGEAGKKIPEPISVAAGEGKSAVFVQEKSVESQDLPPAK